MAAIDAVITAIYDRDPDATDVGRVLRGIEDSLVREALQAFAVALFQARKLPLYIADVVRCCGFSKHSSGDAAMQTMAQIAVRRHIDEELYKVVEQACEHGSRAVAIAVYNALSKVKPEYYPLPEKLF